MAFLVMFVTLIISVFGFSQIFGVFIYKISRGKFEYIITIIIWGAILYGYYILNANQFNDYFSFYKIASIVGGVISFFTIREDKK